MGNICGSEMSEDEKRFAHRSREIQKQNEEDHELEKNKVKLLLLGAGESGKSTVFKQMRQLYGDQYKADELAQFRLFIHQNIIQTVEDLCDIASQTFPNDPIINSMEFKELKAPDGVADLRNFRRFPDLTQHRAQTIHTLWNTELLQSTWNYIINGDGRKKHHIIETAKEFLDRANEICSPTWIPSEQDILHCRVRTTGIREERMLVPSASAYSSMNQKKGPHHSTSSRKNDSKIYQFFDVGGQRNERRKWIHCFEGAHAVIFIVALSEYDQTLWEEGGVNRMEDSLQLFKNTCEEQCFRHAAFILFLNKKDLFTNKIKGCNLADMKEWGDYKGRPCHFQDGVDYFR